MLPETQKENRIEITEKKPKVNPYYLVLSGRFKTAKYITICVLVIFLLASVVLFRDEITVENLRYLFKDLEIGDNVNTGTGDQIAYDSDMQVKLDLYKGDLAIAGSTYFYLCDLQGNKRLNEDSLFSNPVVVSSDKYLLVYGLSEYTYAVYNTFSQLYTESFDYPITSAAMSNDGLYAIVTRTPEYRSVVYLYDENFKRIGAIYKDKYVMDVKFNEGSSELLVVSMFSQNGNYATEIINYVPYAENNSFTRVVENSMPIKAGYNKENGCSIIYDNKIEFYDSEYVLRNTVDFTSNVIPVVAEINDEYTVVIYNENLVGNDIKVLAYNISGENVLSANAQGQPKAVKMIGDYICILFDGQICKIDIKDGKTVYYDTERNALDLLLVDEKTAIVCFSDHTEKINIE